MVPLVTTECIRLLITHNYLIHSHLNYHSSPHSIMSFYHSIESMSTFSSSSNYCPSVPMTTRNYVISFLARLLLLNRQTSRNANMECFANKKSNWTSLICEVISNRGTQIMKKCLQLLSKPMKLILYLILLKWSLELEEYLVRPHWHTCLTAIQPMYLSG